MGALVAIVLLAQATPAQQQQQQQQQQSANAAAAAAGAGAVIVAQQVDPDTLDPFAFPAPTQRARQFFGYASPWTLLILAAALVVLAAFIGKAAPRKRKRIKRATILF